MSGRRDPGLVSLALAASLAACGDHAPGAWRPMVEEVQGMAMCGPETPLNPFERRWFCSLLTQIAEAHFPWGVSPEAHAYRLLYMPSFAPSMSVRIDVLPDGTGILTSRTATRARGHTPDEFSFSPGPPRSVTLTQAETSEYLAAVAQADLWRLPVASDSRENPVAERAEIRRHGYTMECMDGTMLVHEAVQGGRYHLSRAHCAPIESFDRFARLTLRIARDKFHLTGLEWIDEEAR